MTNTRPQMKLGLSIASAGYHLAWEPLAGTSFLATLVGVTAALALAAPIYLSLGARMGVMPRNMLRDLRLRGRKG